MQSTNKLNPNVRQPLPITNQKMWNMSATIIEKLKAAKDIDPAKIDWGELEGDWFDWLEEMLFEEGNINKIEEIDNV